MTEKIIPEKKRLPMPTNLDVDNHAMFFKFVGKAGPYRFRITDADDKVIVYTQELECHRADPITEEKVPNTVKFNLLDSLDHGLNNYGNGGTFKLQVTAVANAKHPTELDSEIAKISFTLTEIQAYNANKALRFKGALAETLKKLDGSFSKTITSLLNIISDGKTSQADMAEKIAKLGKDVEKMGAVSVSSQENMVKIKELIAEAKVLFANPPAATAPPLLKTKPAAQHKATKHSCIELVIKHAAALLAILMLLVAGLVALGIIIHHDSHKYWDNDSSSIPAAVNKNPPMFQPQVASPVPIAPAAPVVITTTNITIINNYPPAIQTATTVTAPAVNDTSPDEVWFPLNGQSGTDYVTVYPGKTFVYYIRKGWQVTAFFDQTRIDKETIGFDPNLSTEYYNHVKGVTLRLRSPYDSKQIVCLEIVPKPTGY